MYFQAIFLVNSNPFKQFRNYVESFYHTDNKPQILRLIIRVILLDKSYIIFTWQILIFENKYKRKDMIEPFRDYGDFVHQKDERIVCFNVSKTYLGCERPNLYECTRKYWRLNGQRAKKADLVFAICSGYIVGIFKPHHWFPTQCEKYKGRWEFEGEQIFDSPYQNQDISKIVRNRQNPVMYINM